MAAKQIAFDEQAREALRRGMDAVVHAVEVTLGPKGRNVVIDKKWGPPLVINDGVTIAKEMELEDPYENMGAQLIKQAAIRTEEVAGDGTTTATVLAQAMVTEGLRNVAAGASPMILKNGMRKAVDAVVGELKAHSRQVTTKEETAQVAGISAGDPEIGQLIADVMARVGKDGVITVEEGKGLNYETNYVEGMEFDRGFISPYLITNPDRMEAELEEPYILVTDRKISAMQDLLPVLEGILQAGKPLLVIAEDVEGEALATLVVNKLRGSLSALAVKAPGFGDRRKAMLEDIAILTGGQVISEEAGFKLEHTKLDMLGHARRVTSDKDKTIIIEGSGKPELVQARIKQINAQIKETTSDYDKEQLQERAAKLAGGVAVIKVGAATEVELKEKKHRVDDALQSTRAAVEEGIVAGGGVALVRAAAILNSLKLSEEEQVGVDIVRHALEEPLKRIVANAGQEGAVVIAHVKGGPRDEGYDALGERYVNMYDAGIIDPLKVTRTALENAGSIAAMVLTTEVLVADRPETREQAAVPPVPEY